LGNSEYGQFGMQTIFFVKIKGKYIEDFICPSVQEMHMQNRSKFNGVQIKFNGMNWNEFCPQIHPGSLCPSVQIKWWDKISQSVPNSCTMIWDKQRTIFARKASLGQSVLDDTKFPILGTKLISFHTFVFFWYFDRIIQPYSLIS
jgi:hypothetical protein